MFLGLDLGTSGLRALLVRVDGSVVGSAEATYPVSHPQSGWSEQNPADWVTACESVVAKLRAAHPQDWPDLSGIAVAGQMHGATLLDAKDDVLRPCILWNDTRSFAEATELDGQPGMREISGNIVFPGFTAPKLVWLARHEPKIFERVAKVLLPKDYLTFWLTGEHVSEMSDAAGTAWLDVEKRAWSPELLDASGMRIDQMPRLVEGSALAGRLRASLAQDWGISQPVAVAGGGGDNAVAACGVGALSEGDGFVSLGTSGVLLAAKDSFAPMPETAVHTFCHAIPETWYQMGVILAATDSLNWLARNLGQDAAALSKALGDRIDGPGMMRFLPYLSGERTPHNDSSIRGALLNLDIAHGPSDLTQAVMEGVAFALRDNLEALKSTGTTLDRVLAIGGGAQSPYWVELCATLLDLPIDLPAKGEFGAAMGAARLAQCAATGAAPKDVMSAPEVARTVPPRPELQPAYEEAYRAFRATYPALKDLP